MGCVCVAACGASPSENHVPGILKHVPCVFCHFSSSMFNLKYHFAGFWVFQQRASVWLPCVSRLQVRKFCSAPPPCQCVTITPVSHILRGPRPPPMSKISFKPDRDQPPGVAPLADAVPDAVAEQSQKKRQKVGLAAMFPPRSSPGTVTHADKADAV